MATALLETKLFLPPAPRRLVPRGRLTDRLERSKGAKLLLVSAPAGFGKTTVLAEWLTTEGAAQHNPVAAAWLSLDRGDSDPGTFWIYLIAALRTVEPGIGGSELRLLQTPQPPPIRGILTTLLNDLAATRRDLVLVLDDYHEVESADVHEGMAFLLDHLPPRVHLAITTRADPPLPLARLRARGELVELRAADLRFTEEEAAAYLNQAMDLQLTVDDVAALEGRTEGWIAALQLAALSMQGRDDVAGFIAGFTGDDRYVIDYLVEEVLQRQTDEVQTFLTRTSILNRFTGPLCDAVTGQAGGKAMLETLDRGNLFLVPLDDSRRWYRYHHLFADVLRTRLLDEQPDLVGALHVRASRWFEQNGHPAEAIRHALAGEDFDHAADLVELAIPLMQRSRQEATLLSWLEALPAEVVDARPVLSLGFVVALLSSGRLEGVESHLRVTEGWLDAAATDSDLPPSQTGMVVADHAAWRRLPGAVALHRSGQARMRGDDATTVAHARRALELADEGDHLTRAGGAALLGLAAWTRGDLDEGHRLYADATAHLEAAGHISDTLGCALAMADMRLTQGRLDDAMTTYQEGLRRASTQSVAALRGTADMHVGMCEVLLERNDLDGASQQLLVARELGDHAGLPQNPYRWRVAAAQLRRVEGHFDSALALIDEAARVFTSDFSPEVRPPSAVRARLWVARGQPRDALRWAKQRGLSVADDLDYLREFEHITLARALLASSRSEPSTHGVDEVTVLLERLLHEAEVGQRTGSIIEVLTLLALARQLGRDEDAALVALERALTLAEPERYTRVFLDEGGPMVVLLEAAGDRGIMPDYADRLLKAAGRSSRAAPSRHGLVEPLSDREHDVLRLLATDLSGPQIAGELVVSLNTVRTHTHRIYAKLGVNNRRLAVRRARELDLL
jgi:LuxR family maltose regulon positive regulatory protein